MAPPPRTPAPAVAAATRRILEFGAQRIVKDRRFSNIASAIGAVQYVGIATEVAATLRETGGRRVLDWGAGWGQNALLLRAHGLDVVAYDVEDKGAADGLLVGTGVPYRIGQGSRLPFADREFDGVLNCGVLEHVADPAAALAELRRVLRPRGWLFTYHLPNRHAYTEWLGRRLGRFHHDRTFTRREAVALFETAGFSVVAWRPFHLLPRNVWGRSPGRAAVAARLVDTYQWLDLALLRVPGLASLATAWTVIATRSSR